MHDSNSITASLRRRVKAAHVVVLPSKGQQSLHQHNSICEEAAAAATAWKQSSKSLRTQHPQLEKGAACVHRDFNRHHSSSGAQVTALRALAALSSRSTSPVCHDSIYAD